MRLGRTEGMSSVPDRFCWSLELKPKIARTPLFLAVITAIANPVASQAQIVTPPPSYADLADLSLASPIVVQARITRSWTLKPEEAPDVAPGRVRLLVEADVERLLVGASGMPASIRYLVDAPRDARGRPPKLKKLGVLAFLSGNPAQPGQLRLVARDAQLNWTPALDETVRGILKEAATQGARIRISGITSAFHIPGTVPGESETQIFLSTTEQRPVSLSILRRPGEAARWSVALGDFVDEAARPPEPNTLAWYRLACSLPAALPSTAISQLDGEGKLAVSRDYQVVLQSLGPCGRTRSADGR
jgi:hypothetical protein